MICPQSIWTRTLLLGSVACLVTATAMAAGPRRKLHDFNPDDETVELFQAIEDGAVEVNFIPKDANVANLLIKNKGDKPLNVKLPGAFAGVPVLAQIGGGLGGGGGGGGQGVGGGLGGGGGGAGGGVFNVSPDKVGKIKVATVCLEHGKPDPNPRMKYTIKPVDVLTDKPEVVELCKMLGRGEIDTTSAQAAAWHLQDGLTWQQLAAKEKVHLSNGYIEMYFNRLHIATAIKIATVAGQRAKEQPQPTSPGEQIQGAE